MQERIFLLALGIPGLILIIIGVILLVIGNVMIFEEVSQKNGMISLDQNLTILNNFNKHETSVGVFAVQIMNFENNVFSVRILDPLDNEIIHEMINDEAFEGQFEISESGNYKLIIETTDNKETQVFAAIGPIPDKDEKYLGFISIFLFPFGIFICMIGVIAYAIVRQRNRSD